MLLGQKISDRVAEMRDLPKGIDQRSACRHPDWTGPDDLEIKIGELREITDWQKPIFIKVGATRPYYDTALAVKAGADVVVLDGMQGGTAATQEVFIEHVGIPTLAAIRPAVDALLELGVHRKVQLVVSGGIRNGADVAKALALGADAVSIGVAALIALGDNSPEHDEGYAEIGSAAGFYDDWHEGRDPAGISTQDDGLAARFDPELGGRRLANYLRTMVLEAQTLARGCGKSHLHNLEPEDLVALDARGRRNGPRSARRNRVDPGPRSGMIRLQIAIKRRASEPSHVELAFMPYAGDDVAELEARQEPRLVRALEMVAPGTAVREGVDSIVQGRTGALICIGESEELSFLLSGGVKLDVDYTPALLYQLAKMDGAIVLASNGTKILWANVQLMPDPTILSLETGTRHRTAERVSKQTDALVIAISAAAASSRSTSTARSTSSRTSPSCSPRQTRRSRPSTSTAAAWIRSRPGSPLSSSRAASRCTTC